MKDKNINESKNHKDKIESDQSVGEIIMFSENQRNEGISKIQFNKENKKSKFDRSYHETTKSYMSNEGMTESQYRNMNSDTRR